MLIVYNLAQASMAVSVKVVPCLNPSTTWATSASLMGPADAARLL